MLSNATHVTRSKKMVDTLGTKTSKRCEFCFYFIFFSCFEITDGTLETFVSHLKF